MSDLVKQLKKIRVSQKISQGQLGEKLGLPQSHVSKIEAGQADVRLSTLTDMARLLGVEIVLVPRIMLPAVTAMLHNEEDLQKPRWQPDEEGEI